MKFTIHNSKFTKKRKAKTKIKQNLSNSFYRAVCILALFLMTLVFIPSENQPVYAETQADVDNLNAQISTLTVQLNEKRAVAKTFADEVAIYDGKIQQIQLQIQATQTQINVQNNQITDINGQIATKEADLKIQKESLREQLKVIYENSNTSTLELIASSESFSDFVDQTEYLQTMQIKTKETIGQIKSLKQQLEDNKNNVEKKRQEIASLQQTQLNQKSDLDKERYSKQLLLSQANSQGSSIQGVIAKKEAEKKKVQDFLNNPPAPPPIAPPPIVTPPPTGGGTPSGSVPQLYQTDSRWAWTAINDGNRPPNPPYDTSPSYMRELGCKITSLAMIFNYYGYGITPGQIAQNPNYFDVWFNWDLLHWGKASSASGFSLRSTNGGIGEAEQWASWGKPFIASANMYGWGYHSVVITGKTANGSWIMNDPISGGGRVFPMSKSAVVNYVFVN